MLFLLTTYADHSLNIRLFLSGHRLEHIFLKVYFGYTAVVELVRFLINIEPGQAWLIQFCLRNFSQEIDHRRDP